MTTAILENVNFKLLLQQHGGNFARAKQAWDKICGIGGFGSVPHTYEGGLDVRGMHVLLDEAKQGQATAEVFNVGFGTPVQSPSANLEEKINKIQDIASGDDPSKVST